MAIQEREKAEVSVSIEEIASAKEREKKALSLFMVVKPDGGRYLAELDQILQERQLAVREVYFVDDWERMSRAMYQRQLESSSRSFTAGFESHVWLCKYLFGNEALILLLDSEGGEGDLVSQAQFVHETRDHFRSKFTASYDTFVIAVNMDRLPGEAFRGSGKKKGLIGVSQPASFDPLVKEGAKGRWFGNYFKYIHTPGTYGELVYQFNVLSEMGFLDEENRVSPEDWKCLKFMHCLIPPSKYRGR